jgi:hypothetical protein
LAEVGKRLAPAPQPHRDHPYWLGAIAAHRAATGQKLSPQEWDFVLGGSDDRRGTFARFLWQMRRNLYGHIPTVRPWHPHWADFRLPLAALRDNLGAVDEFLIVSDSPGTYTHWLWRIGKPGRSLELSRLLTMPQAEQAALAGTYGGCLLVMTEGNIRNADRFIRLITTFLTPSASLFILIFNSRLSDAPAFAADFAYHAARFVNLSMWVAETSYVRSGRIRWALRRQLVLLARRATSLRLYDVPYLVIVGGVMSIVSCLCNVIASRATAYPPRGGLCSSIFLVFRPSVEASSPAAQAAPSEAESTGTMALDATASHPTPAEEAD